MFHVSRNRAVLTVRIDTRSPLLIKAASAPLDPTRAELAAVRTRHASLGETVYIPGSSLKGVLRSAVERSFRDRAIARLPQVCDPLAGQTSCGERLRNERDGAARHRAHCPACRMFGSTALRGRIAIRDLFPFDPSRDPADPASHESKGRANRTELRPRVSINRLSGGTNPSALFDMEVVPAGASFWGEIALVNYQLWQLGALLRAIGELNKGTIRLGGGKSHGLGRIGLSIVSVEHEQQPAHSGTGPAGVGLLAPETEAERYGLLLPDGALDRDVEGESLGLARRFHWRTPEAIARWAGAAAQTPGSRP
ncbi:MAG: hypothetical protein FJW96_08420 [Actinobacteria bacterium]|nr:hypothetical protein [Actinomycetota bacterium]